ncbi:MAG: flavodoxin family protein [Promethearchaeota archaeon]
MAKKITIILGSPRKNGNSATLAQLLQKGAEEAGAVVDVFFIQGMNIKPCNACDSCITNPGSGCVIDDGMEEIYNSVRSADSIVIASPIYWFNISAQTKIFIDRCYALTGSGGRHAFTGKKIAIILTYGDTDPFRSGAVNALRSYQDMFRYVGAKIAGVIYGSAMAAGQINNNQDLLDKAYNLGKKLGS